MLFRVLIFHVPRAAAAISNSTTSLSIGAPVPRPPPKGVGGGGGWALASIHTENKRQLNRITVLANFFINKTTG
jgi:hypothetical protein